MSKCEPYANEVKKMSVAASVAVEVGSRMSRYCTSARSPDPNLPRKLCSADKPYFLSFISTRARRHRAGRKSAGILTASRDPGRFQRGTDFAL